MSMTPTGLIGQSPTRGEVQTASVKKSSKINPRLRAMTRLWVVAGAYVGALLVFAVVVILKGASPIGIYHSMLQTTIFNVGSMEQVLLRAVPISLAALAVAVPARAGLVNVGGEGQLILGAVAATGIGVAIGSSVPGPMAWVLMAIGGAVAGALWAGVSAILRTGLGINEAVSTLLMNFVANDVMLYLIYQPWRDPFSSGQPQSKPLAHPDQLPILFSSQLNLGVIIALVLAILTWYLLKRSNWGFALRVVGGNQEAARRAGLPVKRLMVSAMMAGGALAGLGGMANLAGLELQLRPGITASFGYVAFLASWLGRHDPIKVVGSAILFSAIALSGNGIQLNYGLDGSIVDILLALIVAAPLVLSKSRKAALK